MANAPGATPGHYDGFNNVNLGMPEFGCWLEEA